MFSFTSNAFPLGFAVFCFAVIWLGHLAVQFICSLGTTYGTRQYVIWQIISFVGMVAVHAYCLLQLFDPAGFTWGLFFSFVTMHLPFLLVAHQIPHFLYLFIVRRRQQAHTDASVKPSAPTQVKQPLFCRATLTGCKLAAFILIGAFYLRFSDLRLGLYECSVPLGTALLSFAIIFAGHFALQFICLLGTTYGTRHYAIWQIICFVGIVAVHIYCSLQIFEPYSMMRSQLFTFSLLHLPFILIVHEIPQLAFLFAARQQHGKLSMHKDQSPHIHTA